MAQSRQRLGSFVLLALAASLSASTVACKKDVKPDPSAASASATASAAPVETGVVFTKKAPAVGDKREETSDMSMDMSLSVDIGNGKPNKSDMKMKETIKQSRELLAMNGDAPSKVKVTFTSVEEKMDEGGKSRTKPSAVVGKTYVVEAKDGKTIVTDDKGKTPPANELKEVEKHFKSLGKPDPMASAIPSTPLKPGDKVESLSKALTDYMNKDGEAEGMKISNVVVTFKEKSGDDGIFDITMVMAKEDGPMAMTMDLKGSTTVSIKTSQPTKIDLKGPLTIATKPDPKSKMKMDGSGNMSMAMTSTAL